MAKEAQTRTKVVMVQDATLQVKSVRVNGVEFAVTNAGPVLVPGGMGVNLTIADADVTVEAAAPANA